MAVETYLGNPPQNVIDWIKSHSQPAVEPSPYFTYDENRVITGLYQGSPNVHDEGTYIDPNDGKEKPYSGWTYGGSDVVENYATAIGNNAFNDIIYNQDGIPPSKTIIGNITFQNVTSIGTDAFQFCVSLTNVTMPNVTSIGYTAFQGCYGLMGVTIGSEIQRIGQGAFNTYGDSITLTIGKTVAEVQAMGYSEWYLPSGSTIVCTDETITID